MTQVYVFDSTWNDVIQAIHYKPGWKFAIWTQGGQMSNFLRITTPVEDAYNLGAERILYHDFLIPPIPMDEHEKVRWIYHGCILRAEGHESAEWFRYGTYRPYAPHHGPEHSPYEDVEHW